MATITDLIKTDKTKNVAMLGAVASVLYLLFVKKGRKSIGRFVKFTAVGAVAGGAAGVALQKVGK